MSSAQAGVGLALAEISRAAVEPYQAYSRALRERHEVTGVSFEALKHEAEEGELFANFVSDVVGTLPALETADLRRAGSDAEYNKQWDSKNTFLLGKLATGFTSQDSVEAEAIGSSIVWTDWVPQYLVGATANNFLIAQPQIKVCSDRRYDYYTSEHIERDQAARAIGKFANKSQLDHVSSALHKATVPKIAFLTDYYNKSGYYFGSPGKTNIIERYFFISDDRKKNDGQFLALATNDVSEKALQNQSDRLRMYFDADQTKFVIDAQSRSSDATVTYSHRLINNKQGKPNYKFLNPKDVAEYKVLERLTVLAVRFGKLEQFAGQLGVLYATIADIRGENISLEGQEYSADASAQQMSEHIVTLIQAAREAEEQKTEATKTFRQRLGFGRQKAIG